jgi:phosphatidylethanolamine-binding protein (PEBP) family uncharacterized protein
MRKHIQNWILLIFITIYLAACSTSVTVPTQAATTYSSPIVSLPSPGLNLVTISTTTGEQQESTERVTTKNSDEFVLTSPEVGEGGILPVEYTCDGASNTLPLASSGAPAGTQSMAIIMHHIASPTDLHWYWVLYDIPADVTSLPKNVTGIGTLGINSVNGQTAYTPPCSKGPGPKEYIYTVYALSAMPQLTVPATQVNREILLTAIQNITLASATLNVTYSRNAVALQKESSNTSLLADETPSATLAKSATSANQAPAGGGMPPELAIQACSAKKKQETCQFTSQKGMEIGVCETVQSQLACSPQRGPNDNGQGNDNNQQPNNNQNDAGGSTYYINQAISDKAQGMTIAFDALAFLTGDLGADSFFPPGKVADFWGFQYLRDNDPSNMGHAGDFLTSVANNMLNVLTEEQRAQLVALARSQVDSIHEYGYMRFVLMQAFQNLLDGKLPSGTIGLSEEAVKAYSAQLYQLDGEISYERAQLYGSLINSFTADQKAYLDSMKGLGMLDWPEVQEPADLSSLDQPVKVAVMTYAADMFSWYVVSVEADVYFCPERHGTYFGSFYVKDIQAMSDPSYAIPTNLTGDLGDQMLSTLTTDQAQLITSLVDLQKPSLLGIVDTRQQVAIELRKFLSGETPDKAIVLDLMAQYGEYDGEIIYNMAVHFTQLSQSLTSDQTGRLDAMRQELLGELSHPTGAYLYSQPISMPEIPNTDFLFK